MFYIFFPLIIFFSLQGPLKFTKKKGKTLPKDVAIINFFKGLGSQFNLFDKFAWPAIKKNAKNKKQEKLYAIGCIFVITAITLLFCWLLFEEMFM